MTGIDHQPFIVRRIDQLLQQRLPDPLVTPAAKSPVRVLPVTIGRRQVSPRRPSAQNPEHAIDKAPVIFRNPTPLPSLSRQMGLNQCPVLV